MTSVAAADRDVCFRLYRLMNLIRRTEEILAEEYHPANQMRCPMHLCIGQEAMPAALSMVIRPSDVLMTHYRSHGYYLAKGGSLDRMVAEFYGRASGANSGMAGSMELAAHEVNFSSGAIVSGQIGLALGAAFAAHYRGSDDIAVAVMGDGAMDEGVAYESLNMAALHRLPLLVICENNHYAAHTAIARRMAVPSPTGRVGGFGVPTLSADGNDPEALLALLRTVVADRRAGKGPLFLEIETYRHCAHVGVTSDDAMGYRPLDEIDRWKQRDPVPAMRRKLLEAGAAASLLDETDAAIDAEVWASVAAAKAAPFPTLAEALTWNASGGYSPKVTGFVGTAAAAFNSAQAEAKLAPY